MFTPAYKLIIGKKTVDSVKQPEASTVIGLTVSLNMQTSADSLTVELGNVGGALTPALKDKVSVELGYADGGGLKQVFAGTVVNIDQDFNTTRVVAFTAGETLLRSYVNETYEGRTAGAIVRDLAGKAKVVLGTIEDGISFPAYVIDGRQSFGRHVGTLADLSGFDSYFTNSGDLVFKKFVAGTTPHVLKHAQDILELHTTHALPRAGAVQGWGESPTSSKGEGSWAWLTKNFTKFEGRAGSGKPAYLLERPALRTREAAKAAATALETSIERERIRGRLVASGRPEVQLGDAIQLRAIPEKSLNKTYQVRSVTHRVDKRGGFTTEVGFRSI